MTCLCFAEKGIPMKRLGRVMVMPNMEVKHAFHLDCPDHGIKVLEDRPMVGTLREEWLTPQEAVQLRGNPNVRLGQRSPDRTKCLISWIEWSSMPEEEVSNGEGVRDVRGDEHETVGNDRADQN